ncbi:MAG: Uma2 family endonuclease [Acidimicrobiales bacterium]
MGAPAVQVWQWTAGSFERAGEAGLFNGAHADLIDGEVHVMSPQTPRHAYALRKLVSALATVQPEYVVSVQSPVRLSPRTEPEPDVCVADGPMERYADRHPGPDDIRLVIEVSVSSLGFDLGEKLRVYARHSVPEVWVVDVGHRQVLMYSSPEPDQGVYAHVEARISGRLAAYGLDVEVEGLFPPEG